MGIENLSKEDDKALVSLMKTILKVYDYALQIALFFAASNYFLMNGQSFHIWIVFVDSRQDESISSQGMVDYFEHCLC